MSTPTSTASLPTTAPTVFISYRRDDSAGHVGRLYDALSAKFGSDRLFVDIDHISPGQDFVQVVDDAVTRCAVLLVVMGKRWAGVGRVGKRRIDDPGDFVRLEVAGGLKRAGLRVIPVLVGAAKMLGPAELPDDIRDLARRNAMELSDTRWKEDIARLIAELERAFGPATSATTPTPTSPVRTISLPKSIPIPHALTVPRTLPAGLPRWGKWAGVTTAVLVLGVVTRGALARHASASGPTSAAASAPARVTVPAGDTPRLLPANLLSAGHDLLSSVHSWRDDAVLTQVQAQLPSGAGPSDPYQLDYIFRSPADGAGFEVVTGLPSGTKSDRLPAAGGPAMRPLPDAVAIDLPSAVQTVRDSGMTGDVRSALLSAGGLAGRPGQPAWRILSTQSDHAYLVDAATGKLLHGTSLAGATPHASTVAAKPSGNIFKKIGGIFKKH